MPEFQVMTTDAGPPRRPRARRGDGSRLRGEIVEATATLLETSGGPERVSMADIAAAVGCTQPSIYLHFKDKQSLILAAYDARFEQFRDALLAAAAGAGSPLDALVARGDAYIQWGLDNPAAYRLLFMHQPLAPDPAEPNEIRIHTSASFLDQVDAVQSCIDAGVFPDGDAQVIAIALWASSHGLVSLQLAKPDFGWPDLEVLTHATLYAHGLGIDASLRVVD
jgi:AcrR family transcriptional regulator